MNLTCRLTFAFALVSAVPALAAKNLVLYSARQEQLMKPLLDAYKKETGVSVQVLNDKEGPLVERLKAEGAKSPADLLITVDAGNLWAAAEQGVLAKVDSKALNERIPESLRDPNGKWYGLSVRARTIFFNPKKLKPTDLTSYEGLADPKFKGKLCLRSSAKVYNQSLVAGLIETLGEKQTETVVKGWVANLAAPPFGDDTELLKAIASGQCAVGIANTYYYGRLQKSTPNLDVAIFWPNQNDRGVHVNVSGAGVVATSKNKAEAQKFLEWLASNEAQKIFADANLEFPASTSIEPDPLVKQWGSFKRDALNVSVLGRRQVEAVKLMDRAGYR